MPVLADGIGRREERTLHRKKKVREFPVPSRDVTTKLSLGGNNDVITELFLPRGSLASAIPAGDGKLVNLFLQCNKTTANKTLFSLPTRPTAPLPPSAVLGVLDEPYSAKPAQRSSHAGPPGYIG